MRMLNETRDALCVIKHYKFCLILEATLLPIDKLCIVTSVGLDGMPTAKTEHKAVSSAFQLCSYTTEPVKGS